MQAHTIPITPATTLDIKAMILSVAPGPAHNSNTSPFFESSTNSSVCQFASYYTLSLIPHQHENATTLKITKNDEYPIMNFFSPGSLSRRMLIQHIMYLLKKKNDNR